MALIYCVEDDLEIQNLILYALKGSGYRVVGFEDGDSLYKEIDLEMPDLILLDIMLPREDGLSILKKIRSNRKNSHLPIILVTAKTSEYDRIKGLDLGADDYIVKPFSIMELLARVRAVLRRTKRSKLDSHTRKLIFKDLTLDVDKRIVYNANDKIYLTFKEFELLHYLMENQDIVLSRNQLLERIWGYDYLGETRTVDVHIASLRRKLLNEGKYIKTVRNIGYKLGE